EQVQAAADHLVIVLAPRVAGDARVARPPSVDGARLVGVVDGARDDGRAHAGQHTRRVAPRVGRPRDVVEVGRVTRGDPRLEAIEVVAGRDGGHAAEVEAQRPGAAAQRGNVYRHDAGAADVRAETERDGSRSRPSWNGRLGEPS